MGYSWLLDLPSKVFSDIQKVNDVAKLQVTPQKISLFTIFISHVKTLFQISPHRDLSGRPFGQKFSNVIIETQLV